MTCSHAVPEGCRDEVRDLALDLARTNGALSEIATCWRRSQPFIPGLPPGLPLRLQDAALRIEEDARALADAGPGQLPGQAADLANRFAAFRQDVSSARAMTSDPADGAGDARLWDSADAALRRTGSNLLRLILRLVPDADWSTADSLTAGAYPGRAVLLVSLGQGTSGN